MTIFTVSKIFLLVIVGSNQNMNLKSLFEICSKEIDNQFVYLNAIQIDYESLNGTEKTKKKHSNFVNKIHEVFLEMILSVSESIVTCQLTSQNPDTMEQIGISYSTPHANQSQAFLDFAKDNRYIFLGSQRVWSPSAPLSPRSQSFQSLSFRLL